MDLINNIEKLPENPLSLIFTTFLAIGLLILVLRRNDIKLLREANDDLRASIEDKERQIEELKARIADLNLKFSSLEQQNEVMKLLLEGRDKDNLEYRAQGRIAMRKQDNIINIVRKTNEHIEKLFTLLESHFAK